MGTRKLAKIWFVIGLFGIVLGIHGYGVYSQPGMLFLYMTPAHFYVKDIVLGIISLLIGIDLWVNPQPKTRIVLSIPVWAIMFILQGLIRSADWLNSFDAEYILDTKYLLTIDYLYFILSYITLKELDKNLTIYSFGKLLIKNGLFICIGGFMIIGIIFTLAKFFPYDYF